MRPMLIFITGKDKCFLSFFGKNLLDQEWFADHFVPVDIDDFIGNRESFPVFRLKEYLIKNSQLFSQQIRAFICCAR